jgi:cellobiose dehydrogenase (acceptor)
MGDEDAATDEDDGIRRSARCLIGGGAATSGALYCVCSPVLQLYYSLSLSLSDRTGYLVDADFSTTNRWPTRWKVPTTTYNSLKARLPSTETSSPNKKLYLTQVYIIVTQLRLRKASTANINRYAGPPTNS